MIKKYWLIRTGDDEGTRHEVWKKFWDNRRFSTVNSVDKELANYDYDIFGRLEKVTYGNGEYIEPSKFSNNWLLR